MNDSSLLGHAAVIGEWFLIFEGMQCLRFQWSNSPSLTLECKGNMFIPNVGNLSPCNTVSTYQKTEMLNYTAVSTPKLTTPINMYTILMTF
jgi:hypothetical protein